MSKMGYNALLAFVREHGPIAMSVLTLGVITIGVIKAAHDKYGYFGSVILVVITSVMISLAWYSNFVGAKDIVCQFLGCETEPQRKALAQFEEIKKSWDNLRTKYQEGNIDDRVRVNNAVRNFVFNWTVSVLDERQKNELWLAQSFVEAWRQNSETGWQLVINEHPNDELTPLAEYEKDQLSRKQATPAPALTPDLAAQDEAAWTKAQHDGTVEAYRECLRRFPTGTHVREVATQIDALLAKQAADIAAAKAENAESALKVAEETSEYQRALTCFRVSAAPSTCSVEGFKACVNVYEAVFPSGVHLRELRAALETERDSPK